jgi:hypothetical protein
VRIVVTDPCIFIDIIDLQLPAVIFPGIDTSSGRGRSPYPPSSKSNSRRRNCRHNLVNKDPLTLFSQEHVIDLRCLDVFLLIKSRLKQVVPSSFKRRLSVAQSIECTMIPHQTFRCRGAVQGQNLKF